MGMPADRKNNARYVISVARKIGATVFCTWEDIVEVRPKMMTALMACLMALDRKKQRGFKKEVRCLARKKSVEIDAGGSQMPCPASSTTSEQTQDIEPQPQQP